VNQRVLTFSQIHHVRREFSQPMNPNFTKHHAPRSGVAALVLLAAVVCSSCGPTLPPITETIAHSNYEQERRYVVEGKPVFTPAGQSVLLDLRAKHHYDLQPLQWPEKLMPHQNLEGLSGLRFEVVEAVRRQDNKWQSENMGVRRVWQRDKLLLDTTPRCEVHHLLMRREVEDGVDGDQFDRFFRRQKQLFPHDGKAYLLCGSGIRHFLWTCPECARIQKREYVKPAYYH